MSYSYKKKLQNSFIINPGFSDFCGSIVPFCPEIKYKKIEKIKGKTHQNLLLCFNLVLALYCYLGNGDDEFHLDPRIKKST